MFWVPSIAISGMAFYTGNRLPKWKGDVFVGGLRTGEIPGTGHLERILFNEKMEELRRESLLTDLRQRIRDVRQGPDELLYLLTDADDGAVLRIEPAAIRRAGLCLFLLRAWPAATRSRAARGPRRATRSTRRCATAEIPEALEGLGLAAWWLDLADVVFDFARAGVRLYLSRDDRRGAARVAVWLAWDYWAFRGEQRRRQRLVSARAPPARRPAGLRGSKPGST